MCTVRKLDRNIKILKNIQNGNKNNNNNFNNEKT